MLALRISSRQTQLRADDFVYSDHLSNWQSWYQEKVDVDHSKHLKNHCFSSFCLQRKRPLKMCSAEIKARKVWYLLKNIRLLVTQTKCFVQVHCIVYYVNDIKWTQTSLITRTHTTRAWDPRRCCTQAILQFQIATISECLSSCVVLCLSNDFVVLRKFSKSWKIRFVFQTLGTLHSVQNMWRSHHVS